MRSVAAAMVVFLLASGGCVRRTLTVTSDPPGALVHLNGEEFGRTPVTREFTWYGKYDVVLRHEGSATLHATRWVSAPWWQWPPMDLFAEALPLTDRHYLHYTLRPTTRPADAPERLVERAESARRMLRSSQRASTSPTTAP